MNLVETIKNIQGAVGVTRDGIFGPVTAGRVLAVLNAKDGIEDTGETPGPPSVLDARTLGNIETLDQKARERFVEFACLANATAATFGCQYILISGNRTFAEQDALYAKGRTAPGGIVTNARGGQSNHNFGIAGDFGVFQGKAYLDSSNPGLADKVHKACSMHAAACGLEWGGNWTSFKDAPHYEVSTGLTLSQKRSVYAARGSVL